MADQEEVTWDAPQQQEEVSWDAPQSLASQVGEQAVKGAKGIARGAAGFVGDLGEAVMGGFGAGPTQRSIKAMENAPEPTEADLQKHGSRANYLRSFIQPTYGQRISGATGIEDKKPGFAGTIGEFAGNPASYFGPGGWLSKLIGAGVSGAGSEAAGQLAEGTPWEGPMRVAGAFAGPLTGHVAAPQLAPEQAMLAQRGVTQMTPGQLVGGFGKTAEDSLSSVPLLGSFINSGRRRSIESFNQSVGNQALAPINESLNRGTAAGHEAVAEVGRKLGDAYDAILPRLTYTPDRQFALDMNRIRGRANDLPQANIDQFERIINQRLGPPAPMDGLLYKDIESELNQTASGYMSSSDHAQREMGQRISDVVSAMKGVLERSNTGADAKRLQDINQGWAMFTRMRTAAANRTTSGGVFTPNDLLTAVKRGDKSVGKGSFARGDALMQRFAEAGQKVLPSSVPTSGTAERAMMAGVAGTAVDAITGGHAGSLLAAHPVAALTGAAAIGAGSLPYTRPGMYLANRYANPGATRAALGASGRGWGPVLRPFMQTGPFQRGGIASVIGPTIRRIKKQDGGELSDDDQAAMMPETFVNPAVKAAISGAARQVATPGKIMQRNPYPPGSEEADWYEGQRSKLGEDWARDMALNTMGAGTAVGVPAKAGEEVLAAGAARKTKEASFPQYAEQYPEVGPPTTAIDPKSGKEYLAKQPTPEADAFMKERGRISKDMEKNGYEPYFDPSKRFDVDPANYPPNVDTRTITPKKQVTIDKDLAEIGAEDTRQRLRAAFRQGQKIPDTADWYAMGQLESEFVKELGPKAGRQAFRDRFATSMAATTGGADPTSNFLMSQYGNYLRARGMPYPQAAYEMPSPIGGRYATGNIGMHQKIMDEGGFSGLGEGNPKRHNFAQNFMGNPNLATMDEQMTSGMRPGINMPPPGKYGLYEQVLGQEAAKAGVSPRNYQDVAWAGFKNLKDPSYTSGKPMIAHVNDAIERTHRLTGMPKQEIVRRGIVRGEVPVYGFIGNPVGPFSFEPPDTSPTSP